MSHDGMINAQFDSIIRDLGKDEAADTAPAPAAPDDFTANLVVAPALDPNLLAAVSALTAGTPQAGHRVPVAFDGRAPLAARLTCEAAVTAYVSVIPAGLVTGALNLGAHALTGSMTTVVVSSLVALGAGALAVAGFVHSWNGKITGALGGVSAAVMLAAMPVSGAWGYDLAYWALMGCCALAARLTYLHRTSERKARVDTERGKGRVQDAQVRLIDAKTVNEQVKTLQAMAAMQAATAKTERTPNLIGATPEETALRSAFWGAHGVELLYCDVRPTLTGWKATVALPAELSRSAARSGWDKVASALRARGRFTLADGAATNELVVTFVDPDKTGGVSLTGWFPGASWAVVADTGEEVPVPLGRRILFAGTSGSGKSWSARPLMAEASEYADHRLVVLDLKTIEARNWQHRARIATEADQIEEVTRELIAEGERRLKLIPRGQDVVTISPEMPRITVFVDEGGELLSVLAEETVERLRTIARKYRAAEIILVWCTQKPTISGSGHGLDSQISAQMTHKLSLALATPNESRVVFGEDAEQKGFTAHELPLKGWALLRDIETQSKPERLRMRAMSPADVVALPDRPVWFIEGDRDYSGDDQYQELAAGTVAAGPASAPSSGEATEDRAERIRAYVAQHPEESQRAVAKVLGVHPETVRRALAEG